MNGFVNATVLLQHNNQIYNSNPHYNRKKKRLFRVMIEFGKRHDLTEFNIPIITQRWRKGSGGVDLEGRFVRLFRYRLYNT